MLSFKFVENFFPIFKCQIWCTDRLKITCYLLSTLPAKIILSNCLWFMYASKTIFIPKYRNINFCFNNSFKSWNKWRKGNMIKKNTLVASPGSMHETGCLGLVHWDDPEGWCGEGGGFRMGSTCIPVADSFWCLAKLIQCFRFKNKIKLKKKNKNLHKYLIFHSWRITLKFGYI